MRLSRGGVGSNRPLRGGKGSTWEGGMREPFIVCGPGLVPADATCDELCCTIDLLPAVARLAGTSEPRDRADACRDDLGDARTGIAGAGCRPAGRVDHPRTLLPVPTDAPWVRAVHD